MSWECFPASDVPLRLRGVLNHVRPLFTSTENLVSCGAFWDPQMSHIPERKFLTFQTFKKKKGGVVTSCVRHTHCACPLRPAFPAQASLRHSVSYNHRPHLRCAKLLPCASVLASLHSSKSIVPPNRPARPTPPLTDPSNNVSSYSSVPKHGS